MTMMLAAVDVDLAESHPMLRSGPVFREVDDFADRMVLERRVGSRVKIARPIKVIDLANGRHIAGRSRDVSSTGMRLEIPMTNGMRPGDTIHVDVGLLSGIGPLTGRPRVIPARVIWVNRQHKMLRPLLTAGVEFEPQWDAAMYSVA